MHDAKKYKFLKKVLKVIHIKRKEPNMNRDKGLDDPT